MIRFLLLFSSFFGLLNCANIWGNPHSTAAPPKTVPVMNDMRVEPAKWWTGMKHNQIEILVQREAISTYTVKLGATKGIKLLKVRKVERPNDLYITLNIAARAKPQMVPIIFTKGETSFTVAYPILFQKKAPKVEGAREGL